MPQLHKHFNVSSNLHSSIHSIEIVVSTNKLKKWTLISQSLIIVGLGHAALPIGVLELIWFVELFSSSHESVDKLWEVVPVISLLSLIGQVLITFSIINKSNAIKRQTHVAGLLFLVISFTFFIWTMHDDPYTQVLYVSCIPFVLCVTLTFIGKRIKNFFRRDTSSWLAAANTSFVK